MTDYKKMYLIAADAMEKAVALLIDAQQKCENVYIETSEEELLAAVQKDDVQT